ncbi:hypothetical protein OROHE_002760 [Orobanche hederae]
MDSNKRAKFDSLISLSRLRPIQVFNGLAVSVYNFHYI